MRFILDANLSPKTADFLRRRFSFDVLSLLENNQAGINDSEAANLAQKNRIIITLDLDFGKLYHDAQSPRPPFGVVIIRTHDQRAGHVNELLDNFFNSFGQKVFTENPLALAVIEDAQVRTIN